MSEFLVYKAEVLNLSSNSNNKNDKNVYVGFQTKTLRYGL